MDPMDLQRLVSLQLSTSVEPQNGLHAISVERAAIEIAGGQPGSWAAGGLGGSREPRKAPEESAEGL